MAIIVETGHAVAGANSFISLADFVTYCDARGRDTSAYDDDSQVIPALITMADYLNSLIWKGVKTGRDNPMAWPRYGTDTGGNLWNQLLWPVSEWVGVLDRDGFYIDTASIPKEVVNAQCEGAWLILQGKAMEPSLERGGMLKREKYDIIEFEYFSNAIPTTEFKAVTNRLIGLLKSSNSVSIARG